MVCNQIFRRFSYSLHSNFYFFLWFNKKKKNWNNNVCYLALLHFFVSPFLLMILVQNFWMINCYHIKTWVWKSIWLTWRKLSHLLTFDMLNRVFQIAERSGGLKILLGEIFLPAGGNLRRSDFGQSNLSQS